MKVAYNQKIFYLQKTGGISRYITCLVSELIKKKIDLKIISLIHKNIYLKKFSKKFSNGVYFKRFPNLKFLDLISDYNFNLQTRKFKPDIIHDTYYTPNIKKGIDSKKIITVHDFIHEKFQKYYSNNRDQQDLKKKAFSKVDHFICVSENTKKDLIDFYNINKDKISVIYHGADHLNKNFIKEEIKYDKKPFIFYVGNRGKYKNFSNFVEAFSKSERLKKDFNIICFGGGKFSRSEKYKFKILKIEKNVSLDFGDDQKLIYYYNNASALVYPSLYEGFGIPLIEAMRLNCPVICSDINPFVEICKESAIYFDPCQIDEIKCIIENSLYDDTKIMNVKKIGHKRSEIFKWINTSNQTLEVYKKVTKIYK